jgi:hypothetical protein
LKPKSSSASAGDLDRICAASSEKGMKGYSR